MSRNSSDMSDQVDTKEGAHEEETIQEVAYVNQAVLEQVARYFFGDVPRSLDFEILLLKRKPETLELHKRFSVNKQESEVAVLDRISACRKIARNVAAYTCITEYLFAEPRIDQHFFYQEVLLERKSSRSPKTFIDVGCCLGSDIRKLIHDGFPAEDVTGLDCEGVFLKIGFVLYNQAPSQFQARFVEADILNPEFCRKHCDLGNSFHFVHTANVLHLFDDSKQFKFLQNLAFLVKPGGVVWGRQVGLQDEAPEHYRQPAGKGSRFTLNGFRKLWQRATGWEMSEGMYMASLVSYSDLRLSRQDKEFSLEWCIRVPREKYSQKVASVLEL